MLNFKRLGGLLALYGTFLILFSIFTEGFYINVHEFSLVPLFFMFLLFLYYYGVGNLGSVPFALYRHKKVGAYLRRKYLAYTLSNLVLAGGSFLIQLGLQLMFNGSAHITEGPFADMNTPLYLYPIHLFLIMEIVGLFIVSGTGKRTYKRWMLGWFFFTAAMFMIGSMSRPEKFMPFMLFYSYFTGTFHLFSWLTYAGWLGLFLVYYWNKDKAVEM